MADIINASPDIRAQTQQTLSQNGTGLPVNSIIEASQDSQTASEFIDTQLLLEAEAREALPYAFDHCTNPLGPLRQTLFSCITCNPPPEAPEVASEPYNPAGVCYSCSIACHGEHTLVELFNRRNFTCDCGTTRLPSTSPCTLRIDPATGIKGPIYSQTQAPGNTYNQNFRNRFCGCGEVYDAHKEKGTMFQCLGLATEKDGGCGEDWWHPECVLGLGRNWLETMKIVPQIEDDSDPDNEELDEPALPLPPGFPQEEDFEAFICYKCVNAAPWIKDYAGSPGFLLPVFHKTLARRVSLPDRDKGTLEQQNMVMRYAHDYSTTEEQTLDDQNEDRRKLAEVLASSSPQGQSADIQLANSISDSPENLLTPGSSQMPNQPPPPSKKRKADDDTTSTRSSPKRSKIELPPSPRHKSLPPAPNGTFSLFLREDFREHFCHCATCYPRLRAYPQLLEEEIVYEPPLSESGEEEAHREGGGSVGTGSLLDRGEAALSNVDRVKAIEGVMAYNALKSKVKAFLQPFAESGTPVGAEDIKAYFAQLRGDDLAIKGLDSGTDGDGKDDAGAGTKEGGRKEQDGY